MIRIPPKADIETQAAFRDVEERLRKLESRGEKSISPEPQIFKGNSEDLEVASDLRVGNDVRIEGSVDAPHLYEGLIKVVPAEAGDTSIAQRVINISGSVAIVPGGLSADSIRCRYLDVGGVILDADDLAALIATL